LLLQGYGTSSPSWVCDGIDGCRWYVFFSPFLWGHDQKKLPQVVGAHRDGEQVEDGPSSEDEEVCMCVCVCGCLWEMAVCEVSTGIPSLHLLFSPSSSSASLFSLFLLLLRLLQDVELFFSDPRQLVTIFTELEEQNLSLIQNSQETEETLEDMRQNSSATQQKM